jgi:hypothetical protein
MLIHVVCFKFTDRAHADEAVARLAAMRGQIPTMLAIDVGRDITQSARSYDVALVTRHDDAAGMAAYQTHPVHQEVVTWIRSVKPRSIAVDFHA